MITVSLCMIVRNEEQTLARCLESIRSAVDEINIIDTGSDDRTKQIALKYTDRVFDFTWVDHFAAARNFSFAQATKVYVMWLDADDVLAAEDLFKLKELKSCLDPSVDSVTMNYHLGLDRGGNPVSTLRRNRLVRRSCGFRWIGAVHEYLEVSGQIYDADIDVIHRRIHEPSSRNIRIFERLLERGETFSARDRYYYANELMDHERYEDAAVQYEQFAQLEPIWLEDRIQAYYKLADCSSFLGRESKREHYTFLPLTLERPRAETCCRIGDWFLEHKEWQAAIFWFRCAAAIPIPKARWGLINRAYYTWYPNLQLCVLYDKVGDPVSACSHNELAGTYLPGDARVEHNRQYFQKKSICASPLNGEADTEEITPQ